MPIKNNFWKMLVGQNVQVFISGAVAYTAQASLAAFVANAVQGELGVFDGVTNLLVSGAGPASVTEDLYIAVMRDGAPERSVTFQIGQVTATRTAYSAPVKQITTISVGIFGTLTVQDITYTARNKGVAGNAVTVTNVVAGNSTPLTIGVAGSAITVNLATSGGGAAISTATQVLAALIASAPAQALVSTAITGTAATVQLAAALANIAGGAAAVVTAGQIFEIGILEQTPGYQPFPTYDYQYVAIAGDTIDTVIAQLVKMINNSPANIGNQNRDLIVTAAYTIATGQLLISAINFGVSFRILTKYDLDPVTTVTYSTPMHLGSGFTQQVQLYQDAGDIYKGVTTNYPLQGSNPADYGKPSDMTIPAMGYNLYVFTGYRGYKTLTPGNKQNFFDRYIVLAVPSSGTTPEVQVKALFGL